MKVIVFLIIAYFEIFGIYVTVNRVFLIYDAKNRINRLKKNKRK